MFGYQYRKRISLKLKKSVQKYGFIITCVFIVFYITRDFINSVLIYLFNKFKNEHSVEKKEVVFLEPKNQGYGDLLFQTPIFESLANAGYKISIVVQKNHLPIVKNNPNISAISYWVDWIQLVKLSFKSRGYAVFLGRSTLTETLFGLTFFKAQKIILDKDIKLWREFFSGNHTKAWQKLIKTYISSDLKFGKPKLYLFSRRVVDKENIRIGVIVGVDKKEKRFAGMLSLVVELGRQKNTTSYLIGSCDNEYSRIFRSFISRPYVNFINKQNYTEVVDCISSMDVVIGTEGSLAHVSTTLGIPTIILDKNNSFWNHSDLDKTDYVVILKPETTPSEIIENLKLLIKNS